MSLSFGPAPSTGKVSSVIKRPIGMSASEVLFVTKESKLGMEENRQTSKKRTLERLQQVRCFLAPLWLF